MKVEIYPKEGLFGKMPPVKECAELMKATENVSWGYFMVEPEAWAEVYGVFKVIPLERRMKKSKEYLIKAKEKLEEVGV